MSRPVARGDDGVATGLALATAALLLFATLAAVSGIRLLVAHRVAGSAADLGALAGAVAIQRGQDGCRAARELVVRSNAHAVECRESGDRLRLVVQVELGRVLGREVAVTGRAHAGPR